MRYLAMTVVTLFVLAPPVRADEEKVPLDKLPKPVLEAAKKRFPKAEAKEASKEVTDGKTVYEISLKENGKNIDVTLTAEGTITTIEKEVAFKDLPKAVAETLDKKYPKAAYEIIEEVIKVADGKETLEYYEAHLTTAGKKKMEVEVLPDGKFKSETEIKDEKKCGDSDDKKNGSGGKKNEKGQRGEQFGFQSKQKGQHADDDDDDDDKEKTKEKKNGKKGKKGDRD